MQKTILLLSHYKEAQNWVNDFLHKKDAEKIAYIMDAKKPRLKLNPDYVFEDKINFEKSGFQTDFIDLETSDPQKLEEILSKYDALYLKGGNTFHLLHSIKKSGFDKIISNLIDQGIIYIGESAGSYITCPNIEMAYWGNQDENLIGLKDLNGLNLVPFQIIAHYTPELAKSIDEEIKKSKYSVKLLTDQDLILIEDGEIRSIALK